jgi:hypothetical protein
MATMLVAGSAFAARPSSVTVNATYPSGAPTTTNNDDSCDIGVAPAATLLLPYFEVDITPNVAAANTTLFTVTNVSRQPQIAHVTLWTDWSYPVLDFNIFLTGYDVQAINLYDIIARGQVAPLTGTSSATTPGARSATNNTAGNPNFASGAAASCGPGPQGGGQIPTPLQADVRSGLTVGKYSLCGNTSIGSNHGATTAVGYATIDVANICSTTLPTEPSYYANEILFDNVLIGDYQQVNPNATTGNYAQGNPMVHIRAIPEGGLAGSTPGTNLPYTFYTRYQSALTPTRDRRQPLPSVFAARFIEGGATGFVTDYKIWREGTTGANATCAQYGGTATITGNADLAVSDIVRFDERENPFTYTGSTNFSPLPTNIITLPETSRTSTASSAFPAMTSGDVAGWMYLNLDNQEFQRASQNWVIVSMFAEGRYAVDFDAAWLGNGCSAPEDVTTEDNTNPIGPAPNVTP